MASHHLGYGWTFGYKQKKTTLGTLICAGSGAMLVKCRLAIVARGAWRVVHVYDLSSWEG